MRAMGKLLVCDRCGKQVFLKFIREDAMDGGFGEKYNVYEKDPEGWSYVHKVGDLCGECTKVYSSLIASFKEADK